MFYLIYIFFTLISQSFTLNQILIESISTDIDKPNYQRLGSTEGNTQLFISGAGFSETPENNIVFLISQTTKQPYECKINGAQAQMITCFTTPAPAGNYDIQINKVNPSGTVTQCNQCNFVYSSSFTPIVNYVVPRSQQPGSFVAFNSYPAVNYVESIETFNLGEFFCDRFDFVLNLAFNKPTTTVSNPHCRTARVQEAGLYNISMTTDYGNSLTNDAIASSWDIARKETYQFRVVPTILNISSNRGSGVGNMLEIQGYGFSNIIANNTVTIEGRECKILKASNSLIQCEVQPGYSQNSTFYAGPSGLKYQLIQTNQSVNDLYTYIQNGTFNNNSYIPLGKSNLLETEFVGYEQDWTTSRYGVLPYQNYSSYMNGFFIAPKDGSYQFRFSADDQAMVYMSSVAGSTQASDMTKILDIQTAVSPRNYMSATSANSKTLSSAVTLTKGSAYYTQIFYKAKTGNNGFTLSVETPLTDSGINTIPEIRDLVVNPNVTVEKIQFNISNAVDGNFRFSYNNIITDPMNITQSNLWDILYQIKLYGYTTSKVMYDANGTVTTNMSLQKTISWEFQIYLYRDTYTVPTVITTKLQGSGVSYNFSRLVAPSVRPTGNYEISFNDKGVVKKVNVSINANADTMKTALVSLGFSKFIQVTQYENIWWNFQNKYRIEYYGYAGTLGNNMSLNLTNIENNNNGTKQYTDTIIRNGTLNQFFEPVPAEMWAYAETKPSVIVTTNKIKSSCPNQNCIYDTIDTDVPVISAYTFNNPELTITLAANTIVNSTSTTVFMNNVNCVISAITATSITCRFPVNSQNLAKINAGSFKPKVLIKKYGYALYDNSLTNITIPLVCLNYSPKSINTLGGAQIFLSFTGVYEANTMTKVYVGGYEVPEPTFFYSDSLVSFVAPKQSDIVSANYTIAMSYNGQYVHCTPDIQMNNPNGMTITSISPQKTMPTYKGDLIINGTNFGTNTSNIQVKLLNVSAKKPYDLPVFKVTDTQIIAYLPGGELGTYKLVVSKLDLGYNNAPSAGVDTFEYDLTVSSISPKTGSINGGLNLTVTGTGFNTQLNRNQIFFYIGNENVQCIVQTATATQLTCQIPPIPEIVKSQFLAGKVYIEVNQALMFNATCATGECVFTFTNTNAVITGLSKQTGIKLNDQIYITGANITAQDNVLLRDSVTKEIFQVTSTFVNATSVHFNVTNMYYGVYDVILNSAAGYSNQDFKIEILPVVASQNQNSFANTVGQIVLNGFGFPKNVTTDDLLIQKSSGADNVTNCIVVNTQINTMTCLVQQFLSANTYNIVLKRKYGGLQTLGSFNVVNQANSTSVSTSVSGSKITVTMAGSFPTSIQSYQLIQIVGDQRLVINGNMSDLTQTSSQLTAQFDLTVSGNNFQLFLLDQNDKYVSFQSAQQQMITLPLSVDAITPIVSSYAGGNNLTITGKGLENSKVYVCDQISDYECKQVSNQNGQLICETPLILTQQSQAQFQNAFNQSLSYTTSFDINNYSNKNITYDQDLTTYYNSASSNCYIDLEFGSSSSVNLQNIKFFVSQSLALNKFEGALIQGYVNGNWVTLMTMTSQNLYSGWNTFNNDQNQYFSKIRFTEGSSTCNCRFAEIEVFGSRYYDQTESSNVQCPVIISSSSSSPVTQNNIVNYKIDNTPKITSISPNQGTTAGGTVVTLAMSNQGSVTAQDVKVIIDNINCPVSAVNSTHITCTTGPRPIFVEPKLEVIISGRRSVLALETTTYLYIDRWSAQTTWGGAYPPIAGNVVVVPKGQNVLLDISTPILNTILVEGRMIIDDANITLQSTNILVMNGGYFQVGTPTNPIQNNVNIILYGDKVNTKQLPMWGNKVIGVMNSRIEIHGKKRNCPWTYIASSINKGDTSFTLMNTGADWKAGEKIVVASTSFDMNEAEEKYIVSNINGVITVDSPFIYFHYSAVETYGNFKFPMRAEVALLSRNIVFKGADSDSLETNYGAHIMMMGSEKSGTIGRFSNLELTQVGQSTIVGKYPIHYHKNGQMPTSYVDSVVCHNSFARFVTLHGTSYVKVSNSVAYNAFGHQYFIEDGSETKNTLDGNLAMNAKQVWTLTNTDVSVANYWVTNPDNLVKNCNSAGTMFYGFWYELMEHPTGPTTDISICPTQTPLLGFFNNTAHTNGKFGLRLKRHAPVTNPCQPSQNDGVQDSWAANPPIMANYKDFNIWKSVEKGIQAEHVGAVKFSNMMIADSGMAGIDVQIAEVPNQAIIEDILVIGASNHGNPPSLEMSQNSRGLYLPRTDYIFVSNITFYNFGQQSGSAAIQTASTSENQCQRRQDGATYPIQKITFQNVTRKIIWNGLFKRDIIQDLDGTFTGNSQATWILRDLPHLRTSQCTEVSDKNLYGGPVVSCQNTFMRKISFYNTIPSTMQLLPFRIVNTRNNITDETFQTIQDMDISVQLLPKSWSFALQSGETYHVQVNEQSKWQKMNIYGWDTRQPSEPLSIVQFNVSTPYELFDVVQQTRISGPKIRSIFNMNNCSDFANNVTLSLSNQTYKYGDFAYNNGTMELQVAINGNGYGALNFQAITCRFDCPVLIDPATGRENFFRRWSDPLTWPDNKVPKANVDVLIPYVWQLMLDVDPEPIKNLVLEGNLIFENNRSTLIQAKNIWVKQGALMAGNSSQVFTQNAVIELTSTQFDDDLIVGSNVYAGNNVMFNSGNISLYGKPPNTTKTRLTASVNPGDKILNVEACNDWKANDQLIISTTEKEEYTQNEIVTIAAVEGTQVHINEAIQYFHYGNATAKQYSLGTLDMRAVVAHLTRNIKIKSSNSWACRIYSDKIVGKTNNYEGQTTMIGVEVQGCGQVGSGVGALDILNVNKNFTFQGSTITGSKTFSVRTVSVGGKVTFENSIVANTYNSGFQALKTNNIIFQDNVIIGMVPDPAIKSGLFVSAFDAVKNPSQTQIVKNNIIRGIKGVGFTYPGYDCSNSDNRAPYLARYSGNQAGQSQVGLICYEINDQCVGCTSFTAYGNKNGFDTFENVKNVTTDNMLLAENEVGSFTYAGNHVAHFIKNTNHVYDAMPRLDCASCYQSNCGRSLAFNMPVSVIGGAGQKPPQPMDMSVYISLCSESSFGMDSFNQNFTFINFKTSYSTKPSCQASRIIGFDSVPRDINSFLAFKNTKLIDSDLNQFVTFRTPDPKRATWEGGCGKIVCTGYLNVLISDTDGTIFGSPTQALPNNNYQNVINSTNCVKNNDWNGYKCSGLQYGLLRFYSMAWDARKVMNIPVLLRDGQSENQINMLWEWHWLQDGSPKDDRLQAYWTLFQYKNQYEIIFPGNVPSIMKLLINRDIWEEKADEWLIVHYQYQDPSSYSLKFENGTKIQNYYPEDSQNYDLKNYTNVCGKNMIDYQNRTLTMIMNKDPNCVIVVTMLSVVKVTMRFSTSFQDFYSNNGKATLVDKLSTFLGVGQDQISIVSVRAGSTVIDYHITPTEEQQNSGDISSIMSNINTQLSQGMQSGGLDLSAIGEVTSFSSTVTVVSNKPPIIVQNNTTIPATSKLNALDIGLIVFGSLFFLGIVITVGRFLYKKKLQQINDLKQPKQIQTDDFKAENKIFPQQNSDRQLIELQIKQKEENDNKQESQENALFKIKNNDDQSNRIQASEKLSNHMKRPTKKDRSFVKIDKGQDSIVDQLEEITKNDVSKMK